MATSGVVARVSEARHMLQGLDQRYSLLCFDVKECEGITSIHSFDRAFGFIDDTLVIVNDVVNDKNTLLEDRADLIDLQKSLLLLNDVLEKLGACQSQVLYLHPLFRHSLKDRDLDIWRSLMATLRKESYCVRALATDDMLAHVCSMNLTFERISLGLGLLIEQHESHFHRFYICSSDEVLSVVSVATSLDDQKIAALQPFFRSLYKFHEVRTAPDDPTLIVAVACETGDSLQLLRPVATKGRQFHRWAPRLSLQMQRSVHQEVAHVLRSITESDSLGIRYWGTLGSAQAALIAINILFTQRVETVFKQYSQFHRGGSGADAKITQVFGELREDVSAKLEELLLWARCGNHTARTWHMITTYARFHSCLTTLINEQVTNRRDERWLKQLRCYIEVDQRYHPGGGGAVAPRAGQAATPPANKYPRSPAIDEFLAHPAAVPGDHRKQSLLPMPPAKGVRRPSRRAMDPSNHRDCEVVMGCHSDSDGDEEAAPAVPGRGTGIRMWWEHYLATVEFDGEFVPVARGMNAMCTVSEAMLEKMLHHRHDKYAGCTVVRPSGGYDPRCHPGVDPIALITHAAALFGKHYHVYDCTPTTPSASVVRALLGAFASGLWLILRGVDRLDPTVIALINEGVTAVRSALISDSPTYQFEGKVIKLESRTFAVFVVREEPDNAVSNVARLCLQTLENALPPVAVPLVPLEHVLKQTFLLVGIDDEARILSRYTASVVQRATLAFGLDESILVSQLRQTLPHVVNVVHVHEQPISAVVNAFYKTVLRQIPLTKYQTFHDIMRSCFGTMEGMDIPGPSDEAPLEDQVREKVEICLLHKYMACPKLFLKKCEQLYEAAVCNFPIVLAGPTGSGKTALWRSVYEACFESKASSSNFIYLTLYDADGLFGKTDAQHEWVDGLFTHMFRKAARQRDVNGADAAHWIVFDGLPDSGVLKMLLPILDPECRCLYLPTGEVIRAPPGLRIIFETTTLAVPPALAARTALIRTDGGLLQPHHYITYHSAKPGFLLSAYREHVDTVLSKLVPSILQWAEANNLVRDWEGNKFPTEKPVAHFPINCPNLVQACFNVINGFHKKSRSISYTLNDDDRGITEACVEPIIMFACVWSFGAALAFNHQQMVAFNSYFRNLIIDKGLEARFPMPMGEELGLVFDYVYDVGQRGWVRWASLREGGARGSAGGGGGSADSRPGTSGSTITCGSKAEGPGVVVDQLIMETAAERMQWMLRHLADKGVRVMLAGAPGSGRSELLGGSLRNPLQLYCASANPRLLQQTAGARLQKSRDNVIRLPDKLQKPLTILLDSLELADPSCLDFVRQMHDADGWYDTYSNDLLQVRDVSFAAAVDSQGILQFSERQLQQFHFISLVEPTYDELVILIRDRLDTVLQNSARPDGAHDVKDHLTKIANFMMEVHTEIQNKFPRRLDGRYIWSLACIDTVLTGVKNASLRTIGKLEDLLRLIINECLFSYSGRFEEHSEEKRTMENFIWEHAVAKFRPLTRSDILKARTKLCFSGVGDYRDYLDEMDFKVLLITQSKAFEGTLASGALKQKQQKLQTLLRQEADTSVMRNMISLLRALNQSAGHIILFAEGVNANIDELSLALFMSNMVLARPSIAECHTQNDWRHTLKYLCLTAFMSSRPIVVLLDEHFLLPAGIADVVALAKHGELPGLFTHQDWHCITQTMAAKGVRGSAGLRGKESVRNHFRITLRRSLKFILLRDPRSKSFEAVMMRHIDAVTHFSFISLSRCDKQHLKLMSSPLAPEEKALDTSMKIFVAAREMIASSPSEQAVNIDVSAGSLINHLRLYPKILGDLRRANAAQQERYRKCIALAENTTDDDAAAGAGDDAAGPWAELISLWASKLKRLEESTHPLLGDALLLSSFITWGAAAKDQALLKSAAEVLIQSDVDFTSFADLKCVYNAAQPEDRTDAWLAKGLRRGAVLPCITLKYSPSPAVVILDPHHIAVSSIRTVYTDTPPKIFHPPYTDNMLKTLGALECFDGVVVLDGVSSADLESSWLKAKLTGLHASAGGDTEGESSPQFEHGQQRGPAVAKGFRLFIIVDDEALADRHPGHIKITCSVVWFGLMLKGLIMDATAQALQSQKPTAGNTQEGRSLLQRIESIEDELTGRLASGAGASAAAVVKDAPDEVGVLKLLREAAAAAAAIAEHAVEHRRRSSAQSGPDVQTCRGVGTSVAMFTTALSSYRRLNPTALFGSGFYDAAIARAMSGGFEHAEPPAPSSPGLGSDCGASMRSSLRRSLSRSCSLNTPMLQKNTPAMRGMLLAAAPAIGPTYRQLQFAWLLLQATEETDGSAQSSPAASLHSSPHISPRAARLKWEHRRSFRAGGESPEVSASVRSAMRLLLSTYPSCEEAPERLLEMVAHKVKRELCTSARDIGMGGPQVELEQLMRSINPRTPLLVVGKSDMFLPVMRRVVAEVKDPSVQRKIFFLAAADSLKTMVRSLVADAVHDGGWVIVSDLMVSPEFTHELDEICHGIAAAEEVHPQFKLIFQSQSLANVPHPLVERATKFSLEPIEGFWPAVEWYVGEHRGYFDLPSSTSRISDPRKLAFLSRVVPCLIIFHVIVEERQRRGWLTHDSAKSPPFSGATLAASVASFINTLHNTAVSHLSFDLVRYTTVRIVYGARLSADDDIEVLRRIGDETIHGADPETDVYTCFNISIPNIEHCFPKHAAENACDTSVPLSMLCLSEADVLRTLRYQGYKFFDEIASLKAYTANTLRFDWARLEVCSVVDHLTREVVPAPFDVHQAFEWLQEANTTVLTTIYPILQPELERYNETIAMMARDLRRLTQVLEGSAPLDGELVSIARALSSDKVPDAWLVASNVRSPSRSGAVPLAGCMFIEPPLHKWIASFTKGYQFFHGWAVEGNNPSVMDLEAFVEPVALLHSCLDTAVQATGVPASELKINLHVVPDNCDPVKRSQNLVTFVHASGVYVNGAAWSARDQLLDVPDAKVCGALPTFFITCTPEPQAPIEHEDGSVTHWLPFPMYTNFSLHQRVATVWLPASEELRGREVFVAAQPW